MNGVSMDRELRKRHVRIWIVLGPILVAGLIVAIVLRPPALVLQESTVLDVDAEGGQP